MSEERAAGSCAARYFKQEKEVKMSQRRRIAVGLILTAVLLAGCSFSSDVFNQRAYEQDVSLKVDALSIMDEAT